MTDARVLDSPQCGFWLIRLAKDAAEVPACIKICHSLYEPGNVLNRLDRSPFMAAFISGEPASINEVWLRRGRPISEREHDFRVREINWLKEHEPTDPRANPHEKIDYLAVKPPF